VIALPIVVVKLAVSFVMARLGLAIHEFVEGGELLPSSSRLMARYSWMPRPSLGMTGVR
jgi:hypothetical protein